jgi:hypothetical protein
VVLCVGLCLPVVAGAQSARVSGYVRRADSREVIRYATVSTGDSIRAQTNADGLYFLRLTPGRRRIRARALGFTPLDTTIDVTGPITLDLLLVPAVVTLAQTDIVEKRDPSDIDPQAPSMSVSRLDLPAIRKTPSVLGEVDPIRSLTLLPGVSRISDFSTAISVRGGTADQNLILLDQATIYNPAHVLGFLSVFNADAVDDITLYKGAIPARYGGRLSSVVDVRQREGNANDFGGSLSIGLLASRALLEGPLPAKAGSYLVAGRRSYADLFTALSRDTSVQGNIAYFYDVNAKTNFKLGSAGTLLLSLYTGRDHFSPSDQFSAEWGNVSGTIRWNHVAGNRLLSKVTLYGSDYDYALVFDLLTSNVKWTSRILSRALRVDETLHIDERQSVDFGMETILETIYPGDLVSRDTSGLLSVRVPTRRGLTTALYADHEVKLGGRVAVRYGARASTFARRGAATIFRYANDEPVVWNQDLMRYEPGVLTGATEYGAGRTISRFSGVEPRASLRFSLTPAQSLKASYARTVQFLLLASRTNAPTPLDVWEPVGPYLDPGKADQVALGWAGTARDGAYEMSAEVYGKRMYNVVDFIDGSDVLLNPQLETAMLQGVGRAYGLELFARKQAGKTTGWVSYTLSRAEHRFGNGVGGRGINAGHWFPSPSSKTHDLSVVGLHPVYGGVTLAATFVASSGLPTTFPMSRYEIDGFVIPEYGPRNAERLPMYHRLDLALTRDFRNGELHLGAYNVYNRFNAQSLSFRQSADNPRMTEAIQTSIFGIVPSISYTYKF